MDFHLVDLSVGVGRILESVCLFLFVCLFVCLSGA